MLLRIAWRNIWRNRLRSLVVISAVTVGLTAGVFVWAFYIGSMKQRINEVIETEVSHVQVHLPAFREEDQNVSYLMNNCSEIIRILKKDPDVLNTSERLVVNGMLSTAGSATGVRIYGVDPHEETALRNLEKNLVSGEYFPGKSRSPEIMISKRLAEKLDIGIGKRVKLDFQTADGELVSHGFKIAGIYKTINGLMDEIIVYVSRRELSGLLGTDGACHEIAIRLKDNADADQKAMAWNRENPGILYESWLDISPGIRLAVEMIDLLLFVIMVVILGALLFGIINTMLMAILERTKEMGVLMALGMRRGKLFGMVMIETILLSLFGGVTGILSGRLVVGFLGESGINLTSISEVLEEYGYPAIIYPQLDTKYYGFVAAMAIGSTLLAGIYPAWKATRLNPVESMRKI